MGQDLVHFFITSSDSRFFYKIDFKQDLFNPVFVYIVLCRSRK